MIPMGRKSSAKESRGPQDPRPAQPQKSGAGRLILIAAIVLAVAGGGYLVLGNSSPAAEDAAKKMATPDASEVAKNEAFAKKMTELGPHKQASYPPIPTQDFPPPRPV